MSPSRSLLPGRPAAPAGDAPCPQQLPVPLSPLKREREVERGRGMKRGGKERKGITARKELGCLDCSNLHFSLSSSDKKLYMCK